MGLGKIKMKFALLKNANSSSGGQILKVGVNDQQCSAGGSRSHVNQKSKILTKSLPQYYCPQDFCETVLHSA